MSVELDATRLRHAMDCGVMRSSIDDALCYVYPVSGGPDEWIIDFRPKSEAELADLSEWVAARPWVDARFMARYSVRRQDFRIDRDFSGVTIVTNMKDAVMMTLAHDYLLAPRS